MTLSRDKIPQESNELSAQTVTFDEFIDWYPTNSQVRYDLRRGIIVEMPKPRGTHSEVAGAIAKKLNYAIDLAGFPYFIPRECIIKCGEYSGYEPDGIILDRSTMANEPLWATASAIEHGSSVKIVIEVVSGNWQEIDSIEYLEISLMETSIEQRLEAVEAAIIELKAKVIPSTATWLQDATGIFKDDPIFDEVLAYGRELRQADLTEDETIS
jgi:Uma2 family endonuclease